MVLVGLTSITAKISKNNDVCSVWTRLGMIGRSSTKMWSIILPIAVDFGWTHLVVGS